jgi:hypothetical protein
MRIDGEFTTVVAIPARQYTACRAQTHIEYWQRNEEVRVEGEIMIDACPVSDGDYRIEVQIRDAAGETRTLEFNEMWHVEGEHRLPFTSDYFIGQAIEVLRVRVSLLRCECADPP